MASSNRWGIAAAGFMMQMALGAVYAWSVFRTPLTDRFHWSIAQVTLTFTISIFMLGVSAFFGGLWLNRSGPRIVALTAGLLYGMGVFLASFSSLGLWWLYLSYGVLGGVGLGFGYIVPVAVLLKWFPDRRGLITGIAVGGFGAGALVTAPVATRLIQNIGVLTTFAYLGVAYFLVVIATATFMKNPPAGWTPERWQPNATQTKQRAAHDYSLSGALKTWQWWALWVLLFLNVTAGISLISQEAPIFREIAKVSAIDAGIMVGIVSIGNAVGRVFWAATSDYLTRRWTFTVMFLVQVGLFWAMPGITGATALTIVSFFVLMCYGGGFGTMPAFTADYFGSKNVGPIYGLMLTAWGCASAFGPLLIAHLRQGSGSYATGLRVIGGVMAVSVLLPLIVRPPRAQMQYHLPAACSVLRLAHPRWGTCIAGASGSSSTRNVTSNPQCGFGRQTLSPIWRSFSSSLVASIGFTKYASQSALNACRMPPGVSSEVAIRILVPCVASIPCFSSISRIRVTASTPSMPGILISMQIRSYGSPQTMAMRNASTASSPLTATWHSPFRERMLCNMMRLVNSSSTMRVFILCPLPLPGPGGF